MWRRDRSLNTGSTNFSLSFLPPLPRLRDAGHRCASELPAALRSMRQRIFQEPERGAERDFTAAFGSLLAFCAACFPVYAPRCVLEPAALAARRTLVNKKRKRRRRIEHRQKHRNKQGIRDALEEEEGGGVLTASPFRGAPKQWCEMTLQKCPLSSEKPCSRTLAKAAQK